MITALSRVSGLTGAALLAVTGFMLTYEVIARYFFVKPTIWAAELSQLCLIWGCLISMAWVLSLKRHITVNAVTSLLPESLQLLCVRLALFLLAVFSVIVAYWGWTIFYDSFERGRTTGSLLNLPIWIAELAVPVGFGLLALQSIHDLVTSRHDTATSLGDSHE